VHSSQHLTVDWLTRELQSWRATDGEFRRSARHVRKLGRFTKDASNWDRRGAIGSLFEFLVYEKILDLAQSSDLIEGVVRRGKDVTWDRQGPPAKLGQNGFFYSKGALCLRGNGQDLAEFDVLIVSKGGDLIPVETVTTKINIKDVKEEFEYKRFLLQSLFSQQSVSAILVSSLNLRTSLGEFLSRDDNHFVQTESFDNILARQPTIEMEKSAVDVQKSKLIWAHDLKPARFDYESMHDQERVKLLEGARRRSENKLRGTDRPISMVKNAFLGALSREVLNSFLETFQLEANRRTLSREQIEAYFDRAVLGISVSSVRPILYLRQHWPNYAKFGPWTETRFGLERNFDRRFTRVFDWLDKIETQLSTEDLKDIFHAYLSPNNTGRQMKKPQYLRLSPP